MTLKDAINWLETSNDVPEDVDTIIKNEIESLNKELEIRDKWHEYFEKEYINKDKIREKIKEQRQKFFDVHDGEHSINEICFESTKVEGAIEILKELLEEN